MLLTVVFTLFGLQITLFDILILMVILSFVPVYNALIEYLNTLR